MDQANRKRRQQRIRMRVQGTAKRPRASVYRSNTTIKVQLIDDAAHKTLIFAEGKPEEVGKAIADQAKKQGFEAVVFDRGGYKYHGRVKAVAEAMREGGLEF